MEANDVKEAIEARIVRIGGMELRFLVDETQGTGDLVVFELAVQPQARVPAPHFHRAVDEVVYGLEGTLTTTLDGKKHEIGPGDSLFIPRGSVHHHANLHPTRARVLNVLTPGSIGRRYFEDMAREINVPGKPDMAKLKDIMQRHGLVPVA
jgi:quercetin dioxygenase-like cupin family protein